MSPSAAPDEGATRAGSRCDRQVQHLEARIDDSGLVAIACNECVSPRARGCGNPEVIVGEVLAVLPAQNLKARPFVEDREVERDLQEAGETMLLAFDA